jgi:hypothetical protein
MGNLFHAAGCCATLGGAEMEVFRREQDSPKTEGHGIQHLCSGPGDSATGRGAGEGTGRQRAWRHRRRASGRGLGPRTMLCVSSKDFSRRCGRIRGSSCGGRRNGTGG